MTRPKLQPTAKQRRDICKVRAVGDGDPTIYSPDQLRILVHYGLAYLRGLSEGKGAVVKPPTPDPLLVVPAFHLREHGHQRIAQTLSRPAPDLQLAGHLVERETDAGCGQMAC